MEMERKISAEEATILSCERPKVNIICNIGICEWQWVDWNDMFRSQPGVHLIDSYYDCPTCAYWLAEVSQCNEKSCKKCISSLRNE